MQSFHRLNVNGPENSKSQMLTLLRIVRIVKNVKTHQDIFGAEFVVENTYIPKHCTVGLCKQRHPFNFNLKTRSMFIEVSSFKNQSPPDTMASGWEEIEESMHPTVCNTFPHHPESIFNFQFNSIFNFKFNLIFEN